jgi:hypothetical protein
MSSLAPQRIGRVWLRSLVAAGCGMLAASAGAAAAPIYSCIDANGKRLTSDRPIAECSTREQRILNPDGSVRRIVPPTMTAEERADAEAREREAAAARVAQQDAIRRDRNLMIRFPNELAHNKARNAALDDVRAAVQLTEKRLAALATERKPLIDEAEFYLGKQMPAKLKQALDANDAATEAQRSLIQNQQAEIGRINALYDVELMRLKKLWGGAQAGSMGPLPVAPAASASGTTAKGKTK